MVEQVLPLPARRNRFRAVATAAGLIRESRIGTIGLGIVLFWAAVAVLAPVLPLHDPLTQFSGSSCRSR